MVSIFFSKQSEFHFNQHVSRKIHTYFSSFDCKCVSEKIQGSLISPTDTRMALIRKYGFYLKPPKFIVFSILMSNSLCSLQNILVSTYQVSTVSDKSGCGIRLDRQADMTFSFLPLGYETLKMVSFIQILTIFTEQR